MRSLGHPAIIPGLFMLTGLFYLFEPFVTAWLEIVAPLFSRMFVFPFEFMLMMLSPGYYSLDIAFGVMTLAYLLYFGNVVRAQRPIWQKNLALVPLIVLPLIWAAMTPLGYSFFGQKRVNSYVVGGWSRLALAGGPAAIRADAMSLLSSAEEFPVHDSISPSEVPPAMRRLGDWVMVQKDEGLVLVGIGRMAGMADQFGYIIYDGRAAPARPWYLEYSWPNVRVWKIADDIYFFEQW